MPDERRKDAPGRSLGRQIAASLTLLVLIAGLLSAGVLALHVRVTASLEAARADGLAAREALGLALAVREHYLHETHTVIQGDRGQVSHHHHWIDDIEERVTALQPRVPAEQRATLERLRETSRAIDELYREQLLPAALGGDLDTVRAHQKTSEGLLREATEAADAVVEALDARAETTRRVAVERSRLAIVIGVIGVVVIGVAAVVIALRLRRAVLAPLARLTAAARRFGAGDFEFRVGDQPGEVGPVELRTLAGAFDKMAVELEARERRLLQTERVAAIGQLTAGIAHEINNPIGVIRGYLKTMLPSVGEDQGELREELQILDEEAAACQRIVEDLLTYAREPQLERRPVTLAGLLEDAARRFASTPEGRERALRLELDADSDPESEDEDEDESETLELDPVRMQQVLANLLRNAADASPPEAEIVLAGRREGPRRWRIEVRDRGPGIAEDRRERVFEPFFTERRGGSGLGLAISRSIVEAHGGRIAARPAQTGEPGARIVIELGEERSASPHDREEAAP